MSQPSFVKSPVPPSERTYPPAMYPSTGFFVCARAGIPTTSASAATAATPSHRFMTVSLSSVRSGDVRRHSSDANGRVQGRLPPISGALRREFRESLKDELPRSSYNVAAREGGSMTGHRPVRGVLIVDDSP